MAINKEKNASIVPVGSNCLVKAQNLIAITNKILLQSSEKELFEWWSKLTNDWKKIFLLQIGEKKEDISFHKLKAIKNLENLSCSTLEKANGIFISHTPEVNDLSPLLKLKKLRHLSCCNKEVRDISFLANLKYLEELWLSWCPINDITPLIELKHLKFLYLKGTNISSIKPLLTVKSLKFITISGLSIPLSEIEQFKSNIPTCKIG